jgi:DNA-binding response OmpR family regulator
MANKKLLIVEDEVLMSKNLEERFTQEGYQVATAVDGEVGLATALKEQPDIILLDIILPKLDGLALLKQLREANAWGKAVPVILLTNLNVDDNMLDAITRDKPAYYLVKTDWSMEQIVAKVKERLERVATDTAAAAVQV